ncbi:polysaccharide export protein [Vibrio breoganii]
MKSSFKTILPLAVLLTISGCTVPGSHLSTSGKNVQKTEIDQSKMSDEERANTPVEQVNVYPLTFRFVSELKQYSLQSSTATPNTELEAKIANYDYIVGIGDILNITVWDHPELTIPSGSYRSAEEAGHWVRNDGTIYYPYIGFVHVAGKNVTQIRHEIATRLARYIESPQVDVNIAGFRSQRAYVTGEVDSPMQLPITNVAMTLLDAVNMAGGLDTDADWRNVTVSRNGKKETVSLYALMFEGDLSQNRLLQNGDIIHIPRNDTQKVFVLGDAKSPSMLKIDRAGMTLTEAITEAGGINELSADATGIFVIRSAERDDKNDPYLDMVQNRPENKPEKVQEQPVKVISNVYVLNVKDAANYMLGTEFELQASDVVYVTAAPIERYNRVIRQLLPTVSAVDQTTSAILQVRSL